MVLEDHVKKGKKLLPPMVANGYPIELGNWPLDRVPEFFWIAFMVERLGGRETLNLVTRMSKSINFAINKVRRDPKVIRAYLMSEHLKFSDTERKNILCTSRRSKWFQTISPLIAELLIAWPELPAGYLTTDESQGDGAELVDEIKDILHRFSHRHDELAAVVQSIVALAEIRSGHVSKLSRGLKKSLA